MFAIVAASGCGGSGEGPGAGDGDDGDNISQPCAQLLSCTLISEPDAYAAMLELYGEKAACWDSPDQSKNCASACQSQVDARPQCECSGDHCEEVPSLKEGVYVAVSQQIVANDCGYIPEWLQEGRVLSSKMVPWESDQMWMRIGGLDVSGTIVDHRGTLVYYDGLTLKVDVTIVGRDRFDAVVHARLLKDTSNPTECGIEQNLDLAYDQ
ncbi:MAG: hypothetical protein AB7P03_22340 [Kofleriaceae bacterium]